MFIFTSYLRINKIVFLFFCLILNIVVLLRFFNWVFCLKKNDCYVFLGGILRGVFIWVEIYIIN